ncbi:hypothetical protein JQC91_05415 [Jannaschia sp. Os4]|uniref:hypothetical protein n=1 Tax=Jannaschia sp. Os4 TaxID=2807617 RepID=UPI001939C36C|nr:hypothetical protein [Jannaschia sp. Os4]MBM2575738.1 hypothetical protein [Jannaschia sp. Os4]
MSMTRLHDPVGPRALADLAAARATPGPLARLAAWRARRRDAALLAGLSREAARDVGLPDWRTRRSAGEAGPPPRADRA